MGGVPLIDGFAGQLFVVNDKARRQDGAIPSYPQAAKSGFAGNGEGALAHFRAEGDKVDSAS